MPFMTLVNENEQPEHQQGQPTINTLEQKINELATTIRGTEDIYKDRKKTITQQLQDIKLLASDLNVDNIQLRRMIIECFIDIGVSLSWLRKLLPEDLKLTEHRRKDYLRQQRQQDQHQALQQQQQEAETFTALGWLKHNSNEVPIRVTVNTKAKTIERMELAYERIRKKNYDDDIN
jgi:hypothetical protein